MNTTLRKVMVLLSLSGALVGCGKQVSSDEQAERAYLGLDPSIDKALQLGFDGYNAATSANIPDQTTSGDASGTLTVGGQVDAGQSTNKVMNLRIAMTNYSDGVVSIAGETVAVTYATPSDPNDPTLQTLPLLSLTLHNVPNGDFTGELIGLFQMTGDLDGEVTLDLTMSGLIEEDGVGTQKVRRVAGSTTVSGTATTTGGGLYTVNVTL